MSRISKGIIEENLKELDKLYSTAKSNQLHAIFYSKLALIEYCGWLESSIDILITRVLKNIDDSKLLRIGTDYIKQNYGFTYDRHFLPLLIKAFGLRNAQEMIEELDSQGALVILKAKLDSLAKLRNDAAHNYHTGGQNYYAPNYYLKEMSIVYPIFNEIHKYIVKVVR